MIVYSLAPQRFLTDHRIALSSQMIGYALLLEARMVAKLFRVLRTYSSNMAMSKAIFGGKFGVCSSFY